MARADIRPAGASFLLVQASARCFVAGMKTSMRMRVAMSFGVLAFAVGRGAAPARAEVPASAPASAPQAPEGAVPRVKDPFGAVTQVAQLTRGLEDILIHITALPERPGPGMPDAEALARVDEARRLHPSFLLPAPRLLPQIIRYLNAELAARKAAWRVALCLNPAAGQDAFEYHSGLLRSALPPDARRDAALAAADTATLGGIIASLAESLGADLLLLPGREGAGTGANAGAATLPRLVLAHQLPGSAAAQRPDPHPMGLIRPCKDMLADFADILHPTAGFLPAEQTLAPADPRAAQIMGRLRALRPRARLPQPVLLSQALRHWNAEVSAQGAPERVWLQLNPGSDEDAIYTDLWLYQTLAPPAMVQAESLGAMIDALRQSYPHAVTLCPDGTIVVHDRLAP